MATKTTGWSCTHSTSVVSETDTTKVIRVTCYWTNSGWNYNINGVSAWVYCAGSEYQVKTSSNAYVPDNHGSYSMGYHDFTIDKGTSAKSVSCYAKITSTSSYVSGTKSSSATSVSVAAKPSYTVTYNANGGSGAPANQTKWYGTNLTLSSTKPTRTGYTFKTWYKNSATSGLSYSPGATYSTNSDLALYAVWTANTYTVTYNANGGSGVPATQTKTYGVDLTLSSTKPTRTDYNFLGWATSINGGVVYESGATYTNNSAVTLYAVWELAYIKPRITSFAAQRCNSNGIISEDGTYVIVKFNWATDFDVTDIQIEWKTQNGTWSTMAISASGTSGTVTKIVGDGLLNNETSYIFRAYVKDRDIDGTTYTPQILISTAKYPFDVKRYGAGIAFGKAAEYDDMADFAYTVRLGGGLTPVFLDAETDLNDVLIPNFYTGENISSHNYVNCPLTSGTFYLEVASCGDEKQVRQRISSCNKNGSVTFERFYYQDAWGSWNNAAIGGVTSITTSGTDVNNYVTSGIYSFSSSSTPTNVPDGVVNGWLMVIASSTTAVKQLWYRNGTVNTNDFQTYVRTRNGSSWSNWSKFGMEPVVLYDSAGINTTVTLSDSAANYSYLEIFFTDNNGRDGGYTKIYSPNGKTVDLSIVEACENNVTYIRRTAYSISGTSMTPNLTRAAYLTVNGSTASHSSGTNYIKIIRVLGHQ